MYMFDIIWKAIGMKIDIMLVDIYMIPVRFIEK